MYMCHRAAGAVWIAERCGQVSDGGGRRSHTSPSSSGGGNGCGRTGEERTARDEEARWQGRLPKKKKKNEGQRFAAAEGRNTRTRRLKRLTTAIPVLIHPHPLNQMARTGFSRSYVLILERKQIHLPIKVVIKHKIKWEHLKELKVQLTENIMRKLNIKKTAFHPQFTLQNRLDVGLNSKVCFRNSLRWDTTVCIHILHLDFGPIFSLLWSKALAQSPKTDTLPGESGWCR